MIAERIAADDTLTAAVAAQGASDAAALAAEVVRVNDLIATGMWLFADQAAFPAAADNHGRIVHSHADASMFYAHAGAWHKIENEAEAEAARLVIQNNVDANEVDSDAAEAALSGRLDTLEADPTTAAAVAAGDAATLSSANTYTDTAVSNVIGTAPGVLDTLGEIADAINDDANVYTTLVAQIAAVQADVDGNETYSDAAEAALSGRLDTLEADPTTATALAAVQADVDANEVASDAAESALSGRLDTLEADPTTATAVAAVQSDVDSNQTASESADTALSGRLDVLEADPTTATAVAAVQADVDQNEADSDAADAALGVRIDAIEDGFAFQGDISTTNNLAVTGTSDFNGTVTAHDITIDAGGDDAVLKFTLETDGGADKGGLVWNRASGGADIGAIAYHRSLDSIRFYTNGTTNFDVEIGSGGELNAQNGFAIGGTSVTATAAELNYVDGVTSNVQTQLDAIQADVDQNESDADTAIALRAPIDAPTFTGVPAAPTAGAGTNTTQVATTAFVTTAVAALDAAALRTLLGIVSAANDGASGLASGQMYFNTGSSKYVLVA